MYDLKENLKEEYSYFIFVGHAMEALFLAQSGVGHGFLIITSSLDRTSHTKTSTSSRVKLSPLFLLCRHDGIGVAWCVHRVGKCAGDDAQI